jgi:hypothetical protein
MRERAYSMTKLAKHADEILVSEIDKTIEVLKG